MSAEQFVQALYAAAIVRLGTSPAPSEAPEGSGVCALDAGVLYALLLLFSTQSCSPPVHVYFPLGVCRLGPRPAVPDF